MDKLRALKKRLRAYGGGMPVYGSVFGEPIVIYYAWNEEQGDCFFTVETGKYIDLFPTSVYEF